MATNQQLFGSTPPQPTGPRADEGLRRQLRLHPRLGGQEKLVDRPGHDGGRHHGLLHPGGAAGALGARPRLRRVRPLVRLRADRDAAEPRLPRRHEPGPHGRQDAHVHRAVHLRLAHAAGPRLGRLRLRRPAADPGHLHRHRRGPGRRTSACSPTSRPRRRPGRSRRSCSSSRAGARPATASTPTTTSRSASSSSTTSTTRCATARLGQTLLIITYDEHGGCYDHVPPPWGAAPPDNDTGEFGFDFTRFGVRVPTVLVSPLIPAGTVFRVPAGRRRSTTPRSSRRSRALGPAPADRPRRRRARRRRRAHATAPRTDDPPPASPCRSPAAASPAAGVAPAGGPRGAGVPQASRGRALPAPGWCRGLTAPSAPRPDRPLRAAA